MIEGRIVGVVEDTRDGCAVLITEGMAVGGTLDIDVGRFEGLKKGTAVGAKEGAVVW